MKEKILAILFLSYAFLGISYASDDNLAIIDPKFKTILDVEYPSRFDSIQVFFNKSSILLPQELKIWESQLEYLSILEKHKSIQGLIHIRLGELYKESDENEKSKNAFVQALSMLMDFEDDLPKPDSLFAKIQYSLGKAEIVDGQFGDAKERIGIALEHYTKIDDSLSMAVCHFDLGRIYETLDNSEEAIKEFDLAINLFEILKSELGELDAKFAKTKALIKTGNDKLALTMLDSLVTNMKILDHHSKIEATLSFAELLIKKADYKKAETILSEEISNPENAQDWDQLKLIAEQLALLNEKQNLFDKALEYRKIEQTYIDSFHVHTVKLNDEKSQKQLFNFQAKLKNQQLAFDKLMEEKTLAFNKFKKQMLLGGILVGLLGLCFIYFNYWKNNTALAQKNSELVLTKQNLFNSFSSEFKTPINNISDVLERINAETLNDRVKALIVLANATASKMYNELNLIINWNRYHSKSASLNPSIGNLTDQLSLTFNNAQKDFEHKEITWILDLVPEKMICEIDFEKLDLLVKTMLENIVSETPAGGIVSLTLRILGNQKISLIIKDNGDGIPKAKLKELFEWNYNEVKADKASSGYNMAFAFCKDLTTLMNGKLNYIDNQNSGKHFACVLPFSFAKGQSLFPASSIANTKPVVRVPSVLVKNEEGRPNVLLLIKHEELADYMSDVLSDDYSVSVSNNSKAGLGIVYKEIPDLIVIDLQNEQDGFRSFVNEVKSNLLTDHIPLLCLHSKFGPTLSEDIREHIDLLIEKPLNDPSVFKKTLSDVLEKNDQNYLSISETNENHSAFFNRFIGILNSEFFDPKLNVESIALKMKMSKGQLFKKTNAVFNESPSTLLRDFRLDKAEEMKASNEYTIEEICKKCGFESERYFAKIYNDRFHKES